MISLDGLGASTDEVVLLVGAGSVANAWEPVLDALGRRLPDRSAESANVYFATLVQRLRWLSALAARDTSRTSDYRRELSVALHEYQRVITDISQRLQDAKLELRSEATVLREKLLDGFTAKIVSTNWDFTADELVKDDQDSSIDHIHGTFSVGLYLPNEVADEPYRDPDNRREFSTSMLSTVPSLICAQRLVVYGLSVSPLDAELGFVLQWAVQAE